MRLRTGFCDGPGNRRVRRGRGLRHADTTGRPLTAVAVTAESGRASRAARHRRITRAVREVSHHLGNTPAACRSSSVGAAVLDHLDGVGGRLVGARSVLGSIA
ncbi:hypothetical protein SRB17_20750 [Streptomyces sp. RB17]|uniref:hypothetical protein n=1 Tax=Streptomyces sp. RB17 TaxID=2585197 RepID=UPI00130D12F0|nr:hypothetical protein [Streptomyces sp. RB17]MQY34109.1 hypothetical protein [Streptomyces sp. RB17]